MAKLPTFKHATIIGVGLLGGSVALALRKAYRGIVIAGVGRRQASLDTAVQAGIIDTTHLDPVGPSSKSDLIILATPVGSFERHLKAIASAIEPGCLVTDVGSTKALVVSQARRILGRGGPFVGSHPMAGSEHKGCQFARAELLAGATCVVTPTADTPSPLVARTEGLWRTLGMNVVRMTPARHDQAVAKISHLPHLLSALLMLLPDEQALGVSASGFRDMTRLSGSDVEMWRDILLTNRVPITRAIRKFASCLADLQMLLECEDIAKIEKLLTTARHRREKLLARRK